MSRRPTSRAHRRLSLWRLLRANLYDFGLLLRESWLALAGFAIVALLSTLYLALLYPGTPESPRPEGPAEALYETLKLLTLQSGLAFPREALGGVIFFLTPLLGLALVVQSVLNFGRLLLDKGSRREAWQVSLASTYRGHVVVCGLGRVGVRVVEQLAAAGYEAVVVELDWGSEFVARVLAHGVPVIHGDAREPEVLRRAGVVRCRALVAAINGDLLNIEIALGARALRPGLRTILRVFSEELDRNLERSLGPNTAFSASALAAPTFAAAAVSRDIDIVLPLAGTLLGVTQLTVEPDSRLAGFVRAVEEAEEVRVLHHQTRGGRAVARSLMSQLGAGDRVTLLSQLPRIDALRLANARGSKLDFPATASPQPPHEAQPSVIVCGLGKVGYRVVRQLYRLSPPPRIVVVRLADGRPEFINKINRLEGMTTVTGDARDPEVLRQAGIDHATAVAALTADDLLNLQVGLAARELRPDIPIVLRTFSDALAERLSDLVGIRTTYSTSALAASTLAAAAVIGDVRHAFFVGGELMASVRFAVPESHPIAGASVAQVRDAHGAHIIAMHGAQGQVRVLPPADARITAGDEVTLLATLDTLSRVRGEA
ncbi:MAG: hypothetical protein RLZZ387_532 [Chloroflexota bacterium]